MSNAYLTLPDDLSLIYFKRQQASKKLGKRKTPLSDLIIEDLNKFHKLKGDKDVKHTKK